MQNLAETQEQSETTGRDNYGHHPGSAKRRRSGEAAAGAMSGRGGKLGCGSRKESNVREPDGKGGHSGKRHGGLAGGQTQRRRARDRRDDHSTTARPH